MPSISKLAYIGVLVAMFYVAVANAASVIFVHHSVGRNLISEGNVRALVSHDLWDLDYDHIGLTDPNGNLTGESYGILDTDPEDWHDLWTTSNSARESLLYYDVILFKSCYSACDITSDAMLDQYKDWYVDIKNQLSGYPDKVFVMMSPPPRIRARTTPAEAARAREFAEWLGNQQDRNVRYFDLFDLLAGDDNVLRSEYERAPGGTDSHPNAYANSVVGPIFADFINEVADPNTGVGSDTERSWGGTKLMWAYTLSTIVVTSPDD